MRRIRIRAGPPRLPRRLERTPVFDAAVAFVLVLPLAFVLSIAFTHTHTHVIFSMCAYTHVVSLHAYRYNIHETHIHTDRTDETHTQRETGESCDHLQSHTQYLAAPADDETFFTVFAVVSVDVFSRSALMNENTPVPLSVSVWPTAYLTLSMAVFMDQ